MPRKWILPLVVTLLAAGCRSAPKKKQLAVIPKATSHFFWVSVQAGALAAGNDFGVEILWNGPPSETDYSRQIQILDSMIARRVDGIAIAAAERKALVQPVERAVEANIPVTVFDSGLDSDKFMTFLATNNYEGGQMAARELARLTGGEGEIALLMHAPGSQSTMDREKGFEDTLAREFPKLKIVARQFGQSDRAKSRSVAENFLAGHPNLKGIFASAEPGSIGAALAVKARGLQGKVQLVTFDSSDTLIENLREGVIQTMIVQDPFRIGYEAVRTLAERLAGKIPPKRIDLSAVIVRKEDLEKPETQKLLFPDLKKIHSQ
ncbi:MAG: substrate-binding domain-containing protein [Bryobacteraceae bacterium]|nr:substrate-binding domain-containing protein [Bryobacteraceae bacterium]MDW8379592.1 substrate-binding domain-containing protein [Bryobacterales bacterium]